MAVLKEVVIDCFIQAASNYITIMLLKRTHFNLCKKRVKANSKKCGNFFLMEMIVKLK